MPYREDLLAHLERYKVEQLGKAANGMWRGREYPHILRPEDKWFNLLEDQRELIRTYLDANKQIQLHSDFSHLNSSQAFALNLFVPFFENGREWSDALLRALGQVGPLGGWQAEGVPCEMEGTNIDARWTCSKAKAWTVCEVKLSEQEFGSASADQRHLEKLEQIYLPVLRNHIYSELCEPRAFLRHYQILRNFWHTATVPGGHLILLMPAANKRLWPQVAYVLDRTKSPLHDSVTCVAIEKVLHELSTDDQHSAAIRQYAQKLTDKYVVPEP